MLKKYTQNYTGFYVLPRFRRVPLNGNGHVKAGHLKISAMCPIDVLALGLEPEDFPSRLFQNVQVPVIRTRDGFYVDTECVSRLGLPEFEKSTVLKVLQNADQGIKDGNLQPEYFIPNRYSRCAEKRHFVGHASRGRDYGMCWVTHHMPHER